MDERRTKEERRIEESSEEKEESWSRRESLKLERLDDNSDERRSIQRRGAGGEPDKSRRRAGEEPELKSRERRARGVFRGEEEKRASLERKRRRGEGSRR